MKNLYSRLTLTATLGCLLFSIQPMLAQGTGFTYQGQLQNDGSPANGSYSFAFSLYNTNTGGSVIGMPVTNNDVSVTNGLFTTIIDFGSSPWNGQSNWLQIAVATNGSSTFTNLSPRQQITPTPYAIYAADAGSAATAATAATASSVEGSNIVGIIPAGQLPANVLTNGASGVNISGTFTGTSQTTNGFIASSSSGFYSTNGTYTITVPANAAAMQVKLWGAGGSGSYDTGGGGGAFAQKTLAVTPGATYVIVVGASGGIGGGVGANDGSGGAGYSSLYGNGGQASSLFQQTNSVYIMEAVAGGGGGGGGNYGANSGQAGGPGGTVATNYAATALTSGVASLSLIGGVGKNGGAFEGGCGGGYGGGLPQSDGQANGGGSYGDVTATGSLKTPANTSDPNYVTGAGDGGAINASGSNGLAVVTFYYQTQNITAQNVQQIALLKWGVNSADNTFTVGTGPAGVCFDGTSIWAANTDISGSGNTVTKLNASTGATLGTYTVGNAPAGICFDGASIWVANLGGTTVTKLNAGTGAMVGTYTVGSGPYGICFDGANVWVANFGTLSGTTVTKLNASTGATLGTYTVGSGPDAICFDGASIWVANYNFSSGGTVTKLNASTGATLGTYAVGNGPSGICFDGANVWVANEDDGTVTKLNASTGATLGTYTVGNSPDGICFDGANVWVANEDDGTVTKLNASTGATLGTYAVGNDPVGICFDGASVWVANSGGTTVTKL